MYGTDEKSWVHWWHEYEHRSAIVRWDNLDQRWVFTGWCF